MRPIIVKCLTIWIIMFPAFASASADETGAREAAHLFTQALTAGKTARLAPILPEGGKILVSLKAHKFSPGEKDGAAYLGISQTRAVLRSLLGEGTFQDGRTLYIDCNENSYAQVEVSFRRTSSSGVQRTVRFRLGLQPEHGHWVLREIRETSQ